MFDFKESLLRYFRWDDSGCLFIFAFATRYAYGLRSKPTQFLSKIFDSNGSYREVKGKGVVGEQPVIHPGHEFEYTSGTPLKTSSGLMHGSYQMEDFKGKSFEVLIPPFSLDVPNNNIKLN